MRKVQPVFLVMVVAMWLPLWLLICSMGGCETGSTGALRPFSAIAAQGITNVVTTVSTGAATVLPHPWGTAVETGGAVVLALLGAWQGLTHSKLNKIEARQPTKEKVMNE